MNHRSDTTSTSAPALVVLIATRPEPALLMARSLASVAAQTRLPDAVVVVCDRKPVNSCQIEGLRCQLGRVPLVVLNNVRQKGAAGSWNTGIQWVATHYPDSYLAVLDDDDSWDAEHLATCLQTATAQHQPDAVVSGLRRLVDGKEQRRPLPANLEVSDFLVGNPGWQGSNTFVKTQTLLRVGGFTDGLASCNDRDLAIRLLSLPDLRLTYTGRFTANWHCRERGEALSTPGSDTKLDGLAGFLLLHRQRMSEAQQHQFFHRAERLFHFTQAQIIRRMSALSKTRNVLHGLSQPGPKTGQRDPLPPPAD